MSLYNGGDSVCLQFTECLFTIDTLPTINHRNPISNHRWISENIFHPRILDHSSPMFLYNGGDIVKGVVEVYPGGVNFWRADFFWVHSVAVVVHSTKHPVLRKNISFNHYINLVKKPIFK